MGVRGVGALKFFCFVFLFHIAAMSLAHADDKVQSKSCVELIKDLKGMQQAQHQLLQSFLQKGDSIANTMDQHSQNLKLSQSRNGKLKKTDFQGLSRSAEALRKHQTKEADLISRFEKASDSLLDQVQDCLQKSSNISSHKSVADSSAKN